MGPGEYQLPRRAEAVPSHGRLFAQGLQDQVTLAQGNLRYRSSAHDRE